MSSVSEQRRARLLERLNGIEQRIVQACKNASRQRDEVTLIAVSKTHDVASISAFYEAGVRDFGESYVQEWQEKCAQLPDDIRWHFIGHLQSRKSKYLTEQIHLVHSLDRSSLFKALNKHITHQLDVLIQVNVADESTKSGTSVDELKALVDKVNQSEHLRLRGLMALPPFVSDPEVNRPHFEMMASLMQSLPAWVNRPEDISILSMGMSADFELAIAHGATHIRVGTALFGARDYGA